VLGLLAQVAQRFGFIARIVYDRIDRYGSRRSSDADGDFEYRNLPTGRNTKRCLNKLNNVDFL